MSTPEVTPPTEQVQEKVEQVQPVQPAQEEVKEDPNWKAVRELRKKEKAEREAAEKRAKEEEERANALAKALEAALSKSPVMQNQQMQNYAAYPDEETEEQRIDRKVQEAILKREQASEKARIEREKNELPERLAKAFPDYYQTVNEDNGAYLEYHHPEIYQSLIKLPETMENCANIYKIVKKLVPNSNGAKKDEIKAENNFNKPKSMSTTSITQGGEAISSVRLTEERRAQNWERMQKMLKGLS